MIRLPDLERPLFRRVDHQQPATNYPITLIILDLPPELLAEQPKQVGVGFAAAADPGSAVRPVPTSAGDRADRANDGGVG